MCTVSWTVAHDRYDLFFNRDELNGRAAESGPEVGQRHGVAFVGPRDGQHGGTWLLTNELGMTIGLLNDYGSQWRPSADGPRFSRGHVVLACAAAANHADVMSTLRALPLSRVAAFKLIAISPHEGPLVLSWQGLQLIQRERRGLVPPLTSSSFATDDVIATRTRCFPSFVRAPKNPAPTELADYHRQHAGTAGAHSVLMRRPDASTRSVTHVRVTAHGIQMQYQPVGWGVNGAVFGHAAVRTLSRRLLAA